MFKCPSCGSNRLAGVGDRDLITCHDCGANFELDDEAGDDEADDDVDDGKRINPKDLPFNYIVHNGDEIPFEKYGEAIAFINANYPGCLIDEFWFGVRDSDNDFDGIPDSPGSGMDCGKYVWKSPDEYSRLLTWIAKAKDGDWDELLKLAPGAADELCAVGILMHEATVCVLERRRDAYENSRY